MNAPIDAHRMALWMIANECPEPAKVAQAALDGLGDDPRPFDELRAIRERFPMGVPFKIEHDGFAGIVRGYYVRLDGKAGVVGQFHGTNIIHVYGEKWLPQEEPAPRRRFIADAPSIFRAGY